MRTVWLQGSALWSNQGLDVFQVRWKVLDILPLRSVASTASTFFVFFLNFSYKTSTLCEGSMNWTKQRLVRFYDGWSRSQRFANLVGNYSSSVAVSISKRSCELPINRSTEYKVLFVSLLISPRDKFPSSCNSPTVLGDLQTVPEWPLFEHLKQVASFAGKVASLWVGEFPQCSQRVDEGWLGDFVGGGFLSLSFGAFFAFLWPRLRFFFLSLQHLGSRFSKELVVSSQLRFVAPD